MCELINKDLDIAIKTSKSYNAVKIMDIWKELNERDECLNCNKIKECTEKVQDSIRIMINS